MAIFKKAILSISIILLIILSLAQIVFGADTAKAKEDAKLKKSMDDKSIILEIIPKKDEFEILEEHEEWYKVNYKRIKGYVKKEQVEIISKENSKQTNVTNEQKSQNTNEIQNNEEKNETKENQNNENLTNQNEENATNQNNKENQTETQQNQISQNELQQNQVDSNVTSEESIKESIKSGDKLYTKSEIQLFLRPLPNSMKMQTLPLNQEVTVIDIANKWVYIAVDGKNGWVRKDLLSLEKQGETKEEPKTEEKTENKKEEKADEKKEQENYINKTAYITSDGINFRKEPNTDCEILKTFLLNAKVTILQEEGKWYKVKHNDQEGYVLKMYVSEKKVSVTSRSASSRQQIEAQENNNLTTSGDNTSNVETTSKENTTDSNESKVDNNTSKENITKEISSKQNEVVALAKKYLGCKYVYGGASPSGFDCSGLTMYIYKQFGISLPHSATAQSKRGIKIQKENLQLGDLVFFTNYRTNKGIGHCGIYIGDNKFIHASTEKTGVITSSLNSSSYQKRYVTAVRMFLGE